MATETTSNRTELCPILDPHLFTFKPKLNEKSNEIAQNLISDFYERQLKHVKRLQEFVSFIDYKKTTINISILSRKKSQQVIIAIGILKKNDRDKYWTSQYQKSNHWLMNQYPLLIMILPLLLLKVERTIHCAEMFTWLFRNRTE